ncbi:hypothetical protein E2C01_101223 [Portunus trituberculatus]|uniref:Uncharacterized protein n=1 Tax=Portunus trituberculatus TaxID=210409 RepID=A0A5B7KFK6_PORTR|nr:hypothetical protein [Portunus trituberculatus]
MVAHVKATAAPLPSDEVHASFLFPFRPASARHTRPAESSHRSPTQVITLSQMVTGASSFILFLFPILVQPLQRPGPPRTQRDMTFIPDHAGASFLILCVTPTCCT